MSIPDAADCDALVALARYGTLSAAARRRGVAVSTISRRIEALEAQVGLMLVDRLASGAQLTDAGRAIAVAAEPLAGQIDRIAHLAASLRNGASQRAVRLSATEYIVSDVLAPNLARLLFGNQPLALELRSEADIVSLAARDADIAVRMVRPDGASLIIRKLPPLSLSLYAARAYLSDRAPTLDDLCNERLLAYDDSYGPLPEVEWLSTRNLTHALVMRTGSTRALVQATVAGAGIALLPHAIAAIQPDLVRLDIGLRIPPRIPYLTFHRDLQRDPLVRRVADWVMVCFRALSAPRKLVDSIATPR